MECMYNNRYERPLAKSAMATSMKGRLFFRTVNICKNYINYYIRQAKQQEKDKEVLAYFKQSSIRKRSN